MIVRRDSLTGLRSAALRVVVAGVCMVASACSRQASHEFIGADSTARPALSNPVLTTLHGVESTEQLSSSTRETRRAPPGDRFVVLDVSAHNNDGQPQVFSEGRLVNVDEHSERSFATPVSMLADEFLTLQVLAPSASVRGKIAWEIPSDLPGVLYWVPGNGSQRILLHVDAPAQVSTSANAAVEDAPIAAVVHPPSSDARPVETREARVVAAPEEPSAEPQVTPQSKPEAESGGGNALARTLACRSLVTRNDPAEKARYLGFFTRECAGQALPSAWVEASVAAATPPPPADTPRWPPRPGPAFNCDQAYTRAEHLVCEDAVLSLMDWELNRAYAQAQRVVDDPDGLRRDEDSWRHRVRDACDSSRCVESVYDRRTAQLEALADKQR